MGLRTDRLRAGLATLVGLTGAALLAPAEASAQMLVPAPATPTDAANRSAPGNPASTLSRPLAPGEQLVVVRGFRIREARFESRPPALHAGLMSAAMIPECEASSCGFVVFEVDGAFRYTSIVAGTDRELTEMAADLEREGLSLVIIYPPASRLRRYYTPTESGMVVVSPEIATIGQPLPNRTNPDQPRAAPVDETGGW